MALVSCPECNRKVSDRATACPQCGCPISQTSMQVGTEKPIELTAKRFKLISLFSVLAVIFGLLLVVLSTATTTSERGVPIAMVGSFLFIFGLISFIINRIRIWWHHK
jgi:uncharacterized membrane protein YvbJ